MKRAARGTAMLKKILPALTISAEVLTVIVALITLLHQVLNR